MQIKDIFDKVQVNSHKNAKIAQMNKRDFQQKENTRKHQSSTTDYMKQKNQ